MNAVPNACHWCIEPVMCVAGTLRKYIIVCRVSVGGLVAISPSFYVIIMYIYGLNFQQWEKKTADTTTLFIFFLFFSCTEVIICVRTYSYNTLNLYRVCAVHVLHENNTAWSAPTRILSHIHNNTTNAKHTYTHTSCENVISLFHWPLKFFSVYVLFFLRSWKKKYWKTPKEPFMLWYLHFWYIYVIYLALRYGQKQNCVRVCATNGEIALHVRI